MIIKISPEQVVRYWETIKFAAVKAEGIADADIPAFGTDLLLNLLNGTWFCWMSLNDAREIQRLVIMSLDDYEVVQKHCLTMHYLYSFSHASNTDWHNEIDQVYKFAKKAGCSLIRAITRNEKLEAIGKSIGFTRKSVNLFLTI